MPDFDEDPLDKLQDNGDGVIETILLSEDADQKPVLERAGSLGLLAVMAALPASLICYTLSYP